MKLLLFAMFILAGCAQLEPAAEQAAADIADEIEPLIEEVTAPPRSWTIVAFGDSLTAGPGVASNETYPAVVQQLLRDRGHNATVYNDGVSGETSAGALQRVDHVISHAPDIVILETGVNDILGGSDAQTANNLNAIIDELQANNITIILAGMEAFGEFGGYRIEVQTMYPDIAAAQDVHFIPFFLRGVAGQPEYTLPDMVHPNAAGYRVIAEQNVLPAVLEVIEGQ